MVPTLEHVYNCTKSTATEFGPYYLMYGQELRLPVDLIWYSKGWYECYHKY